MSVVRVSVSAATTIDASGVLLKETVLRVQAHGSSVSSTSSGPGTRRDQRREVGMKRTEYFRAINANVVRFGARAVAMGEWQNK
ncbi:hypothetical protein GCM10027594_05940 [Hymenobacter agri]